MKISIIVAIDQNNAIGEGNNLMWHLPDDFKWFKQHTTGKPILMGRNTMNSIGKSLTQQNQHCHIIEQQKLNRWFCSH